jgi:release factor glutamine methyltransferase
VVNRLEERLLREYAQKSGEPLDALVRRAENDEPVAYILGEWEFYSLPIKVTRDTLIPRPDTETLVDRAIELLKGRAAPRILDLCAGTGCVGLALAANIPGATAILAELSEPALAVCRENIALNGLTGRVAARRADALKAPPENLGTFDVIVCNPPYIRTAVIAELDASVCAFEPITALDGGDDGLDFYRAVAAQWKTALKKGGKILFEVGYDQSAEVAEILRRNEYVNIAATRDLNNTERVIEGEIK